jgi:transcriptional regulator with XRE-family HTH domain
VTIRNFTAASYVAAQTRNLRLRRGWSQQKLADRLNELLTDRPEWVEQLEEGDPRKPKPGSRGAPPRWTQTRIYKLEGEKLRVTVDDLLELALALDVSPLCLLTPTPAPSADEAGERWSSLSPRTDDVLKVAIGLKASYWPQNVRDWVRGARPLLHLGDYRTDDDAVAGHRFYASTRLPDELAKAAARSDEARRAWRPVEDLLKSEEDQDAE